MKQNKFKRVLALSLVAQSVISASSALAQDANYGGEVFLEELIVTAQKRDESVQEVPITVNAYSNNDLDVLGVYETGDLGLAVPGLEVGNSAGTNSQLILFMRGAGLNDFNTNNAGPIGIYSDEVYVSSPALSPFQLFDAERVEVLKGPQGTLYGRNTTGGAVKFITKKPTRETKIAGKWRISSFNTNVVEGSASGALSDTVSARVAATKIDSDGYGTNLVDGSDTNGTDSSAYRASIKYEPNEKFSVLANIHGAKVNSQATSRSPLGTLDPVTRQACDNQRILAGECVDLAGYRAPDDVHDGNFNEVDNIDLDSIGAYIQAEYEFANATFTSVTAYDEISRTLPTEIDGGPSSLLALDFGVESDTLSQELRLTGSTDRIDWHAGAFYLTETINQNQTVDLFRSFRALTGGRADPFGEATGAPIYFSRSLNVQDLESKAIFGQASYALNDYLNVTLGGRYTDETRTFSSVTQLEEPETFGPEPIVAASFEDLETSDDAFSYRVALDYKPSDNTLVYASASRGFKSGGFNGGFLSLNPDEARQQLDPYAPEFVNAYELGFKSDLFNYKLRLNAAVFLSDFEDLQVFTLANSGGGVALVLDNASDAQAKGVEFDATAILGNNWKFALNAVFMDSELKDFRQAITGQDFSGNRIAQTPETSLTGILSYTRGLSNGAKISAQSSVAYKSDLFFSTENDPLAAQEAYTLVNARLAYTSASENWTLAAYVSNLTDEEYLTNVNNVRNVISSYGRIFGRPRSIGLELSFDF